MGETVQLINKSMESLDRILRSLTIASSAPIREGHVQPHARVHVHTCARTLYTTYVHGKFAFEFVLIIVYQSNKTIGES